MDPLAPLPLAGMPAMLSPSLGKLRENKAAFYGVHNESLLRNTKTFASSVVYFELHPGGCSPDRSSVCCSKAPPTNREA